jgi:uncharacterized protein (DUF433 family)
MATIQSIDLISTDPTVRSGRPCIAGTRIEVTALAIEHNVNQHTVEELASDYGLSLAQVHAALAYYYEHKEALDAVIDGQDRIAQEYREKGIGSRRPPLSG